MKMKRQNPTGIRKIGDPFVLRHEGKYYLYATSFVAGFYVWESEDLARWSEPKLCYSVGSASFGKNDFWAPEVVYHNGKFVMHYTARWSANDSLRIGVAISDSPTGPFIDVVAGQPMFDFGYACIDGHVFLDTDGKRYFYYSRDCSENVVKGAHESHIYVVGLSEDLTRVEGEPVFLFRPTEGYETIQPQEIAETFCWNEGPYVLKHNGKYYLMYSANFYASKNYCLCCAVSDRPTEGFVKYDRPLLTYVEGQVSGPGHNCVVQSPEGDLLCVYHVHSEFTNPCWDRQMFMDKLTFAGDRLVVEGPTVAGERTA